VSQSELVLVTGVSGHVLVVTRVSVWIRSGCDQCLSLDSFWLGLASQSGPVLVVTGVSVLVVTSVSVWTRSGCVRCLSLDSFL
jgi:hypothetical protein